MLAATLASVLLPPGSAPAHPGASSPAPQGPNVVVFFADDMRRDELAFLPQASQLIGDAGVRFTRAYANNPLCCPFRASALSGQHSHNNGVFSNSPAFHGGVHYFDPTRAVGPYLQQAGYRTAYIGKYLNGYQAKDGVPVGWDEWHVPVAGIYTYDDTTLAHNGVDTVRYTGQNITDVYAGITDQVVRDFAAGGRPWVMYVAHLAPHYRIVGRVHDLDPVPPERYVGTVTAADLPPLTTVANVADKPRWIRRLPPLSQKNRAWIVQHRIARAEALRGVDDALASLVQTLRDTGQLDNTVILVTSDNGYLLGEHRVRRGKILPYEVSAGIPLLVRGPGFPAGTTRTDIVGAVDIGTTVLALTGVDVPYPVDGKPLMVPDPDRRMLLEAGGRLMQGCGPARTGPTGRS
ncbi:MAG: sulfatase [Nocardioides sp.]